MIVLPKNADSKAWADAFFKARPNSKVFLYDKEELDKYDLETFSSTMGTLIQEKDKTKFQENQKTFEHTINTLGDVINLGLLAFP